MKRRKLRPVLEGPWRLIGPSPDLRGLLPGAEEHLARWEAGGRKGEHNAPVDHHIFQGSDGAWHLWGCVRSTAVGRILYHWESDDFAASPWRCTGEMIRCDRAAGECLNDRKTEQIQSPYVVIHEGRYHMFYGGTVAGALDAEGRLVDDLTMQDRIAHIDAQSQCQICLMTSEDGRRWTRHRDANGHSRVFVGPGTARDPFVLNIDGLWRIYYVGYEGDGRETHGFACRTSPDLIHWSDWKTAHRDPRFGIPHYRCECPCVVQREGYYYLFRTEEYYSHRTHVFRSEDPMDFGIDDARDKYVGYLPAAAVEIYQVGDEEYVSSNHNPMRGTEICKLRWMPSE